MKLLDVEVDWSEGFSNRPSFRCTFSEYTPDLFIFRKVKCRKSFIPLYWASYGDAVRFFAYKGPGFGYGGTTFRLRMADGTAEDLVGPWSSRAGVMNDHFPHSAGGALLAPLLSICRHKKISVYKVVSVGETTYVPGRGDKFKMESLREGDVYERIL